MMTVDTDTHSNSLDAAFAREELTGLAYMFWGRLVALALLALWVLLTLPLERSGIYLIAIGAFAVLGAPPYLLARVGKGGIAVTAVFLALDVCLLSYLLIVPAPFSVEGWTPQLNLRLPNFLYLGVFLVSVALSYSPGLVLSTGTAAIAAWTTGYLWVANLPGTEPHTSTDMLDEGLSSQEVIQGFLDPQAVSLTTLYNEIVFLALVTLILAFTVWRSRLLVRRQVAAEAQRTALSRYFSPNIVDELANRTDPLERPAQQPAAVLFADMVGFTAISERMSPDALVDLLSHFHSRLAGVAFEHGGTVDKYIGDAIMVHFGTPTERPEDPVRALECAAAMIRELESWNQERERQGEPAIGVGIGLHFGDVLVGNIGDQRRLEYTVLGDTVNVASRLERLTRDIGASLVVSDALVQAVTAQGIDLGAVVADLEREQSRQVRGRNAPIAIWSGFRRRV